MIILFILVIVCVICFIWYKKKTFNSSPDNINVSQTYDSEYGNFTVFGRKNKFVVTKNENISFLVEDGQIVACKDNRISKDYKYYGGK